MHTNTELFFYFLNDANLQWHQPCISVHRHLHTHWRLLHRSFLEPVILQSLLLNIYLQHFWVRFVAVCKVFLVFFLCLDSRRGSCPSVARCPVTSSGGGVWGRLLGQWTQGDDNTTHPWPSAATQPVGNQPPFAWSAVACNQTMANRAKAWTSQPAFLCVSPTTHTSHRGVFVI